jgi:hypothetical protein
LYELADIFRVGFGRAPRPSKESSDFRPNFRLSTSVDPPSRDPYSMVGSANLIELDAEGTYATPVDGLTNATGGDADAGSLGVRTGSYVFSLVPLII